MKKRKTASASHDVTANTPVWTSYVGYRNCNPVRLVVTLSKEQAEEACIKVMQELARADRAAGRYSSLARAMNVMEWYLTEINPWLLRGAVPASKLNDAIAELSASGVFVTQVR